MGFLKKKDDEESTRSALFGSRKNKPSPAPAANPYAAPVDRDPYTDPPPAYSGGGQDQYRREKSPAVTGPGQSYSGGGYGVQGGGYGGVGGYGADRYGGGAPTQRPGGYGGLGAARTTSNDTMSTDAGRDQLFGAAPQRYQERAQAAPPNGAQGGHGQSGVYGQSGAYGTNPGAAAGGYGTYEDRQLTAEEQEEEDISATKSEIRFMKQKDVASTHNALRLAQQAEETGRDTLARLGAQGNRLYNAEKNLISTGFESDTAKRNAEKLATINRSMFAMDIANPFTSAARRKEHDDRVMAEHQANRDAQEAVQKAAYNNSANQAAIDRELRGQSGLGKKSTLADRAKYQFEADSEDDEMEEKIDSNLRALEDAAKRLNRLGGTIGKELEAQNGHLARIDAQTDKVDDKIAINRAKLDRIH